MGAGAEQDHDIDVTLGDLGVLLLDAGTSVTDVRSSLEKVHERTEPEAALHFAILPELVIVSRPGNAFATTTGASIGPLTFRQAAHASRLVRDLESGRAGLTAVPDRIARIRAIPRRLPTLQNIVGTGLLSMGLAVVVRCPWWAITLAFLVGMLVGAMTTFMSRIPSASAIAPFVTALVSTLCVGTVANLFDLGPVPLFAVCAPIAVLVPGALITNALLELTATDIVTGAARLSYGIIILVFMAAGVFSGAAVTGLSINSKSAALIGQGAEATASHGGWESLPSLWFSWLGVALLAAGVGLAFGAGSRLVLVSVAVMLGTYAVLSLLIPVLGIIVATGLAATLLFIAARALERLTLAIPATISFQPAFLLLVPGTVGLVALTSF
ncbi:MAG: threonine/serine exporter family protein, partial [Actinobacteria bacterium]|nr:threonine/serine exporter family protein [Actinomycetota bacterium]